MAQLDRHLSDYRLSILLVRLTSALVRWNASDPYTPANHCRNSYRVANPTTVSGRVGTVGIYSKYGTSTFKDSSDAGNLLKNIPI